MDSKTIKQYDDHSEQYISEWCAKTPEKLHALIKTWFLPKTSVLDVGSGSGRDVEWLCENGFAAEGVDASTGLLEKARSLWPKRIFRHDSLPYLRSIESQSFDNVLAAAVLMHLPLGEIEPAVQHFLRVVKVKGRVICSVRGSREASSRESDGRLFTSLELSQLAVIFERFGGKILEIVEHDQQADGRKWSTIVVEK